MTQLDAETIEQALAGHLHGEEPPQRLLELIGGWPAVAVVAPRLVSHPLLPATLSALSRDATRELQGLDDSAESAPSGRDPEAGTMGELEAVAGSSTEPELVRAAAKALTDSVLATTDPMLFGQSLDILCSSPVVLELVGDDLAAGCLPLAGPPVTDDISSDLELTALHGAAALESLARLSLVGYGSKHKVFGVLEDVKRPQPVRYARAVMRTLSASFDYWTPDPGLTAVIDALTGVAPSRMAAAPSAEEQTRDQEYRAAIAADAEWTRANLHLATAFRAPNISQSLAELRSALECLDYVRGVDDRPDAELLRWATALLVEFIAHIDAGQAGPLDAADWPVDPAQVRALAEQARHAQVDSYGLNHWSGDRKQAILQGWTRLAADLANLQDILARDSLYQAAVVLDDVLSIYTLSHSYDMTRRTGDAEGLARVLRPALAGGFAARAGLLRHLTDHITYLEIRIAQTSEAGEASSSLQVRLDTANAVLAAARARIIPPTEPPGKPEAREASLPPLLGELLGRHPEAAEALAGISHEALTSLAANIADMRAAADLDPDLINNKVRSSMLAKLATCEDFHGDVADAATALLDQLIKFAARRMNTQESSKAYLFDADANEQPLHDDLYEWLSQGPLASRTDMEVQEVGAGRVDIQVQFSGFHFYIEMKADESRVPIEKKAAYIKQAVTYQATDVRIGFLVVLRLAPPRDKSPAPHLTDYISHTTVDIEGSASGRHVVMVEIPGNQTKPSEMTAG